MTEAHFDLDDTIERRDKVEELMYEVLQLLMPDTDIGTHPHLEATPIRWAKMMFDLCEPEAFRFTIFETDCDEMVVVRNIPFYTFCAHHMLPFHGVAHVGYLPQGRLCGLSKLARAVQYFSRGLNVQEELTANIAEYLEDSLKPLGVGVVMEAEHLCMAMRGVQTPGTVTSTSCMRGVFLDNEKQSRDEFLSIVRGNGQH